MLCFWVLIWILFVCVLIVLVRILFISWMIEVFCVWLFFFNLEVLSFLSILMLLNWFFLRVINLLIVLVLIFKWFLFNLWIVLFVDNMVIIFRFVVFVIELMVLKLNGFVIVKWSFFLLWEMGNILKWWINLIGKFLRVFFLIVVDFEEKILILSLLVSVLCSVLMLEKLNCLVIFLIGLLLCIVVVMDVIGIFSGSWGGNVVWGLVRLEMIGFMMGEFMVYVIVVLGWCGVCYRWMYSLCW